VRVVDLGPAAQGKAVLRLSAGQAQAAAQATQRGIFKSDSSFVKLGQIAHDRQSQTGARSGFIGADATLQDSVAHGGGQARSIVIHGDKDSAIFLYGCDFHTRPGPFTGIVKKIAQDFFKVFTPATNRVRRRDVDVNGKLSTGIKFEQSAGEPLHGFANGTTGCRRGTGRSSARVREVIFHLAAHAFNLQGDGGRGIVLACRFRAIGFLRQHGERRFQSMCQIAGFGESAFDDAFTMFQQRVEIVDQGLDFSRISSLDSAGSAVTKVKELAPQASKRKKSGAELPDSQHDKDEGKSEKHFDAPAGYKARLLMNREKGKMKQRNQTERPEKSAKKDPPAEGVQPVHEGAFMW
jgi:hypothetical protein